MSAMRHAKRSKRLVRLIHLAADALEAGAGGFVVLIDVHRPRVGAGGFFLVAEPLVSQAATGPCADALWLDADRTVEIVGGVLDAVDRDVAQAARDIRLGLLHRQPDGSGEIVNRILVLGAALIEQAAVVISLRVIGPDHD